MVNLSEPKGSQRVELCSRYDRYLLSFFVFSFEFDNAVNKCVDRVVFPHTYIFTGMNFRSSLSDDDISGNYTLTTELFHTQSSTG